VVLGKIDLYISVNYKTVMNKDLKYDRWADENEAAEHLKVKPSTLRTRRYKLGHDTLEVWSKFNGRVLYDLYATDKKIEGAN